MATIQLNPVFEGMSKQVGDLVFFKKFGQTYVRRKGDYKDPQSEVQLQIRAAFSGLVESWRTLGAPLQSCWDEYAKGERYTGYNAFIGVNSKSQREGSPLVLAPRTDEFTGFSAVPGEAGDIRCTVKTNPQRVNVTLFLQNVEGDAGCGTLKRRDFGPGAELIMAGLEPGV